MPMAVIFAGSEKDRDHVERIEKALKDCSNNNCAVRTHYMSAHKKTKEVLAQLDEYKDDLKIVFITVAGRSNALSGVVAYNTEAPVIACPPFKSIEEYAIDIHSTLRMPSGVPVLTVIDPDNCALAAWRILKNG